MKKIRLYIISLILLVFVGGVCSTNWIPSHAKTYTSLNSEGKKKVYTFTGKMKKTYTSNKYDQKVPEYILQFSKPISVKNGYTGEVTKEKKITLYNVDRFKNNAGKKIKVRGIFMNNLSAYCTCNYTLSDCKLVKVYKVKKPKLNKTKISLQPKKTFRLKIANPGKGKWKWSSTDSSVAKVSSKGKVTAIKAGDTSIKAKKGKQTLTCKVNVFATTLTLNKTELLMYVGDENSLTVKVVPTGTTVTWSSSNPSVATVNKGVVKAIGEGMAIITVSSGSCSQECLVTVSEKTLTLDQTKLSMFPGEEKTLKAVVVPSGSLISWSSSDTSIVSVEKGIVKAIGEGTAIITASSGGITQQCIVTVSKKTLTLDLNEICLAEGEEKTITATVVPSGETVSWTSSDEKVATVKGGKIKAISEGTAIITASVDDITKECKVIVSKDNTKGDDPFSKLAAYIKKYGRYTSGEGIYACAGTFTIDSTKARIEIAVMYDSNIDVIKLSGKWTATTTRTENELLGGMTLITLKRDNPIADVYAAAEVSAGVLEASSTITKSSFTSDSNLSFVLGDGSVAEDSINKYWSEMVHSTMSSCEIYIGYACVGYSDLGFANYVVPK